MKTTITAFLLLLISNITFSQTHWSKTPIIASDGVMEIGKYIDFHETNIDQNDYSLRLNSFAGILKSSGSIKISPLKNFIATYNDNDEYSARLGFSTLQLGNNGANKIIAGKTQSGGQLDFYVNNTTTIENHNSTIDGLLAMRITHTGNIQSALLKNFVARYNDNDEYSARLGFSTLQLGNNGVNKIIAGKTQTGGQFEFYVNNTTIIEDHNSAIDGLLAMRIANNGNIAIYGKLEAKEINVTLTPTADFVFDVNYKLNKLEQVEQYITENKHLPDIASADEMTENGINIANFQVQLLQKIEELTLYMIDINKEVKVLKQENSELKSEIKELKSVQ